MISIITRWACVATMALVATTALAQNDYERGLLKALTASVATTAISYQGDYHNKWYHRLTYYERRNAANSIADSIREELANFETDALKIELAKVAESLTDKREITNYEGIRKYWMAMVEAQNGVFEKAASSVEKLKGKFSGSDRITKSMEVGYLKGLSIAFKTFDMKYYSLDASSRSFAIRANAAEAFAKSIEAQMPNLENGLLRLLLLDVVKEIRSGPTSMKDFATDIKLQREAFQSAERKLNLVLTEVETASCNGTM